MNIFFGFIPTMKGTLERVPNKLGGSNPPPYKKGKTNEIPKR